ncbi:sensor histidine kinase [Pelomonas sp. HMWF004]|nr:sensor histidine kinase [Pelomonas sp. HMWF004]
MQGAGRPRFLHSWPMSFLEEFTLAMRNQRVLMKHRTDRRWVRGLIYLSWLIGFGLFFAVVNGLQTGRLGTTRWWFNDLPGHMLVSVFVTLSFVIGFRSFEKLAPQRWLDTISGWRDWRSGFFFSLMSIGCSLVGVVIGLAVLNGVWLTGDLSRLLLRPGLWGQFLAISAAVTFAMTLRYRARWKQEMLQARITEAQLKLLQGQIEPHFLFNTLANVQSLIDFDPERAKQMLERFTDYLRASLGQLRGESSTLAQEFAMLEAYLSLMQLRMGERLKLELALPSELSGFELPPLLVQPLVENAIHHGLEPKIAGGTVRVAACRDGADLRIDVEDDGQGLDAPKRRGGGTCARIRIPFPA